MTLGFPVRLISELCCTNDGAVLQIGRNCQLSQDGSFIRHGTLCCPDCNAAFAIDDGILNLLNDISMDEESQHEQKLRNEHARTLLGNSANFYKNEHNLMEMIPTLKMLSVNRDNIILELGCGDGRYTTLLAGLCQRILAVDFSMELLRILKGRLQESQSVGLVLGDVKTMKVCATHFDRVFSTLMSNLPTREHREAVYRLATNALKPDGRFVFSTHHHGYRQRLGGVPKSGRYEEGGIYYHNFTVSECKAEVGPYFEMVKARPIQIYLPFARRFRLPSIALSGFLERIPLINSLGELVLCTAEQPIRAA